MCTLLIANTVANVFLPILVSSFAGGLVGFITSTVLILLLAEIVPQAICSRHGLFLAAHLTWLLRGLMVLLSPLAWPLAWILDKILGREVGNMYSRAELKHLITLHVEHPDGGGGGGGMGGGSAIPGGGTLTREDYKVLAGALDIRDKRVRDVMTPIDKTFMVAGSTRLNFDNMLRIYESGYTRIPVHEDGDRQAIIGILYAKDLILVDPDDEIEVRAIIALRAGVDMVAGGGGGDRKSV